MHEVSSKKNKMKIKIFNMKTLRRKYSVSLLLMMLMIIIFKGVVSADNKEGNNSDQNSIFNDLRIYQVMVESYMDGDPNCNYNTGYGPSDHKGDLKGIIKALPYIKSLGMNAIWLTPIFDSDGTTRLDATGYFCKDYFKVDPKFGTLQDAKDLVNEAHDLGLYVFFDGVFGHHKQGVIASPKGNMPIPKNLNKNVPSGGNFVSLGATVSFPESLEFYKEVATYWIDELGIDGWRLDQCYQLSYKGGQNKNYWKEIREAVEAKCQERRLRGEKWGILGYMVGEDWENVEDGKDIQYNSYSGDGLQSAFDFPSRYKIVRSLAFDSEKKATKEGAKILSYVYSTPEEKGYSHKNGVYPNLFISNHDLVRLGNLLNWKFNLTRDDDEYWKRHKCALAILAAYAGPITIYYGDEYGDMMDGYTGEPITSLGIANDNVGRSNGKYEGFTSKEKNLVEYTKAIMKIRSNNPALYDGRRTILKSDSTLYADLKVKGDNTVMFLVNFSKKDVNFKVKNNIVGGKNLINLEDNSSYSSKNEEYNLKVPGLSAVFYKVK